MANAQDLEWVLEIKTLSIIPDKQIGSWSSVVCKVLQQNLRATASNPCCLDVYWMKKIEDPKNTVIISEWTKPVYAPIPSSHLSKLRPHRESTPGPIIHADAGLSTSTQRNFTSDGMSNSLKRNFSSTKCTADFRAHFKAREQTFDTETAHETAKSFRCIASGWIKETKPVDDKGAQGFLLFLMWANRKAEMLYKAENPHWRSSLVEDIRKVGLLREEECLGKFFQVLGDGSLEGLEISDDSNEEDKSPGLREYVGEWPGKLHRSGWNWTGELPTVDTISCRRLEMLWPEVTDEDRAANRARLDLLYKSAAVDGGLSDQFSDNSEPGSEHQNSVMEEFSDDESTDTTPVLTPSSSVTSLDNLCDDSESMSELPGSWKSCYDISLRPDLSRTDGRNSASVPKFCTEPELDEKSRKVIQKGKCQFDLSSDDEDDERDMGLASLPKLTSLSAVASPGLPRERPSSAYNNEVISISGPSKTVTDFDYGKIPGMMRRYGVARWNPDEELRNAKWRFGRHGRRLSALRLEAQRAALRKSSSQTDLAPSVESLPKDPIPHISKDDRGKVSRRTWWTCFRVMFLKQTASTS